MIDRRTFGKAVGLGTGTALATAVGVATPAMAAGAPQGRDVAGGHDMPNGMHTFDTPKQVRAGVLDIGYAELGPADGPVVIIHHGYPQGIKFFSTTAPLLAEKGYRVLMPYLRGYGTTRFLSARTARNSQQAVLALDTIAFMDALKIDKAVLAGLDWGTTVVCTIAALWPERCKALMATSGYGINDLAANRKPIDAQSEHNWWYQYYFATNRGLLAMEDPQKRLDLARLNWQLTTPTFDEGTFDSVSVAFDNPDHAAIVVQHYRWRLSLDPGEPQYDAIEAKLAAHPVITVPTVTLDPDSDPFTAPGNGASYRALFAGPYQHRALKGIGANVPLEAPQAFADAIVAAAHL